MNPETALTEKQKRDRGLLYDANYDPALIAERTACQERLYAYNNLRPGGTEAQQRALRDILGTAGEGLVVVQPLFCDYGYHIHTGRDCFFNTHTVFLDEAPVTFGDHVFVGPNCSFYTAIHPLDAPRRNRGLELARPIRVGHNVWLGGNVTVLPGVSIGDGAVIGAGSVVTRDVPPGVVAVGNPCRVLRKIEE